MWRSLVVEVVIPFTTSQHCYLPLPPLFSDVPTLDQDRFIAQSIYQPFKMPLSSSFLDRSSLFLIYAALALAFIVLITAGRSVDVLFGFSSSINFALVVALFTLIYTIPCVIAAHTSLLTSLDEKRRDPRVLLGINVFFLLFWFCAAVASSTVPSLLRCSFSGFYGCPAVIATAVFSWFSFLCWAAATAIAAKEFIIFRREGLAPRQSQPQPQPTQLDTINAPGSNKEEAV
ncbi:uncharacterized protein VTP21DRAFT_1340 [Calcarisporiella thermophila]|uniref:uncharacterized protein n=1 Tax=Calcarisporiella thermophila TaxID=911321 RepID=UPI00374460D2